MSIQDLLVMADAIPEEDGTTYVLLKMVRELCTIVKGLQNDISVLNRVCYG